MKELALEASFDYRSCPIGQAEKKKRRGANGREEDECACARSIDDGALKPQDPQHAVKANNSNEKPRLNSKRYFGVSLHVNTS